MFRGGVVRWAISAIIASGLIFALLGLVRLWPEAESLLSPGQGEVYIWGSADQPLRGGSRTFALAAALFYWGTGAVLVGRPRTRRVGTVVRLGPGVDVLFFFVPLLATAWALAFKDGLVPSGPWGVYGGNHGPWRHAYHLRHIVSFALLLPLEVFVGALWAACRGRNRTAAFLEATGAVAMFYLVLAPHYWLID